MVTSKKAVIVERKIDSGPLFPLGSGDVKYYDFNQNNSGGRYKIDENTGQNTIIAARDMSEANERAERLGIYFNGCRDGMDCDCCGDRWSEQYSESKDVEPLVYGSDPTSYLTKDSWGFHDKIVVHHADGTRETFTKKDPKADLT